MRKKTAYAKPDASPEDITNAAKAARVAKAHHFIS